MLDKYKILAEIISRDSFARQLSGPKSDIDSVILKSTVIDFSSNGVDVDSTSGSGICEKIYKQYCK